MTDWVFLFARFRFLSLLFPQEGSQHVIAVGTNQAQVQLWDARALRQIRVLAGHAARVGSLAWNENLLSSGGRDALIINHDIRTSGIRMRTLQGHQQEVR